MLQEKPPDAGGTGRVGRASHSLTKVSKASKLQKISKVSKVFRAFGAFRCFSVLFVSESVESGSREANADEPRGGSRPKQLLCVTTSLCKSSSV